MLAVAVVDSAVVIVLLISVSFGAIIAGDDGLSCSLFSAPTSLSIIFPSSLMCPDVVVDVVSFHVVVFKFFVVVEIVSCHDVVVVSSVVRLVLLLLMNHTNVSVCMSSMTHRWTHRTRRNSTSGKFGGGIFDVVGRFSIDILAASKFGVDIFVEGKFGVGVLDEGKLGLDILVIGELLAGKFGVNIFITGKLGVLIFDADRFVFVMFTGVELGDGILSLDMLIGKDFGVDNT